jgi:SAM-dependent methyltransferase
LIKEYGGNPKFKKFDLYYSLNRLLMRKRLTSGVNLKKKSLILDVGCGQGIEAEFAAAHFKNADMIAGIDICPHKEKWQSMAKRQTRLHFITASALNLPFRKDLFEFVFAKDVLHHIPRGRLFALREIFKVVKPSGILRIIEANRYHIVPLLIYKSDNSHDHLTLNQLTQIKEKLDFKTLEGLELLPSFSSFKKDVVWNVFCFLLSLLTIRPKGKKTLELFVSVREKLMPKSLMYYVLTKKKFERL